VIESQEETIRSIWEKANELTRHNQSGPIVLLIGGRVNPSGAPASRDGDKAALPRRVEPADGMACGHVRAAVMAPRACGAFAQTEPSRLMRAHDDQDDEPQRPGVGKANGNRAEKAMSASFGWDFWGHTLRKDEVPDTPVGRLRMARFRRAPIFGPAPVRRSDISIALGMVWPAMAPGDLDTEPLIS